MYRKEDVVVAVNGSTLESLDGDHDELEEAFLYGVFPGDFIWSTGTSAYQIEGGWNLDGKGESIWDRYSHSTPSPITDNTTGDLTSDHYHLWKKDIQMLKNMGTKYYSLSIAWSRLLPNGLLPSRNPKGIRFYRKLLSALEENGIHPIVKHWMTFHDPLTFVLSGYGEGSHPPGMSHCPGTCPYEAAHNVIKAHTMAYHLYHNNYKKTHRGKVGISLRGDWCHPGSDNEADAEASRRCMDISLGWFANPIFGNGDYPDRMKTRIGNRSAAKLRPSVSRLPSFTAKQKLQNKGAFDFFGLVHHTTDLVLDSKEADNLTSFMADAGMRKTFSDSWVRSEAGNVTFFPEGMRKSLIWVKEAYDNPSVLITGNGWRDKGGSLDDTDRIIYHKYYINSVLKAHVENECKVIGYTAWSFIDSFEWQAGHTEKCGLHFVNFSDPHRPRMPKASAAFYKSVVADNGFPHSCRGFRCQCGALCRMMLMVGMFSVFVLCLWVLYRKCCGVVEKIINKI